MLLHLLFIDAKRKKDSQVIYKKRPSGLANGITKTRLPFTASGVIISSEAENDLKGIGVFTEYNWGPKPRKKYLAQLIQRMNFLAAHLTLAKKRNALPDAPCSFHDGKHVIFSAEFPTTEKLSEFYTRLWTSRGISNPVPQTAFLSRIFAANPVF